MPSVPGPPEQGRSTPRKSSPSTQDANIAPRSNHQEASPLFSARSSPPEPFPELDDDLDSELADLSPCFVHEINSQAALDFLPLPEPAKDAVTNSRAVSQADVGEAFHDSGEMKEATRRGLEWARMMFGKDVENDGAKEDKSNVESGKEEAKEQVL